MRYSPAPIDGVSILELEPHIDDRGAFARTFCVDDFADHGLPTLFPQANLSRNNWTGTLRGLHFNAEPHGESKLVRCVRGAVHDVVVDLRIDSPTRFEHFAIELTANNGRALFVPSGFAHGFITLEDTTDVYYHMGAKYAPGAARGLRWNDPNLAIDWPMEPILMSTNDATYADLDVATFDLTSITN